MTRYHPTAIFPASADQTARRRILISAFAVSPRRGSEPGVGWNLPLRLSQWHDVTVLCAPLIGNEPFREEIEDYLTEHGPLPNLRFEFVPHTPLSRRLQKERFSGSCLRGLYYLGYRSWQRSALRRAWQLHRQTPFDLVHHLNITTYREPGYLWKLPIPFVWGPLTGACNVPLSYGRVLTTKDSVFQMVRTGGNWIQMRFNRRCRRAAEAAKWIWGVCREDQKMVHSHWHRPCELLREVGTTPQPLASLRDYDGRRPLQIIWSGLHIGRKALPLLLHALARLNDPHRWELTVLGSGPRTAQWQDLARQLAIDSRVRWIGPLSQQQALAHVAAADVFIHSSLQEATSTAVIEALSLGVPVICHDACGMAIAVTEACGIKVPMATPQGSIAGFADAIASLLDHPPCVAQLSAGALQRSAELSWDATARRLAAVYDEVFSQSRRND